MYGKLIDGEIYIAPKKLTIGNTQVWNAPASAYLEQGWEEVVFTEAPDDPPEGYYYVAGWTEESETIVQTWTLEKLPDDIDDSEALEILLGGES